MKPTADHGRADGRGIGEIDAAHVGAARGIARQVHVARTQRKPADGPRPSLPRPAPGAPDAAACESHQRRSVDRPDPAWPRNPAPSPVPPAPAAVVKRSEAPGLLIDPGPAPGEHPHPVADAVRCPPRRHDREPSVTPLRVLPVSVAGQRLRTDHIRRDVLIGSGGGLGFLPVPRHRPVVERIGCAQ